MTRAGPAVLTYLGLLASLAAALPALGQDPPSTQPASTEPAATEAPQEAGPQTTPRPAPPLIPGPTGHVRPDDKRRTLRSYGHNLGYNFLAVVQRDNRKSLLIAAGLTAPSFLLDHDAKQYFIDHPDDNFGKVGASLGGSVAVAAVTVGLFSAGRISRGDNFRATSYDLSQAIIVTQVYTGAIKLAVRRERPDGSDNLSFPSGHASNAFAIASVITKHYKKLAIPSYALATYIAMSRMAADKHHFSDIVAGSTLGWSIGRAVVRRNGRPPDELGGKPQEPVPDKLSFQVTPWAGPSGDGRGLALLVRF